MITRTDRVIFACALLLGVLLGLALYYGTRPAPAPSPTFTPIQLPTLSEVQP